MQHYTHFQTFLFFFFFFKQKTAYEISACLVGSEMCIKGRLFTMLLSSEVIQLNRVPHMLTLGLDITQRKQAEAELRASEARLRESEARFSVAFQASPVFITILTMKEGRYVLANDAFLNW